MARPIWLSSNLYRCRNHARVLLQHGWRDRERLGRTRHGGDQPCACFGSHGVLWGLALTQTGLAVVSLEPDTGALAAGYTFRKTSDGRSGGAILGFLSDGVPVILDETQGEAPVILADHGGSAVSLWDGARHPAALRPLHAGGSESQVLITGMDGSIWTTAGMGSLTRLPVQPAKPVFRILSACGSNP